MPKNIFYVVNEHEEITAVQIPYEIWEKIKEVARPFLANTEEDNSVQKEGPLREFETLMSYWDFPYPYEPKVVCPHCNAATDDWKNDPAHLFILTNATIGGLLVFHCSTCGTTIRQKYFKDHVCYEHTTPQKK